jgi:hypothetical protein
MFILIYFNPISQQHLQSAKISLLVLIKYFSSIREQHFCFVFIFLLTIEILDKMETKTKQQKHKERKEKKRKSDSNVKGEQWRVKRQQTSSNLMVLCQHKRKLNVQEYISV